MDFHDFEELEMESDSELYGKKDDDVFVVSREDNGEGEGGDEGEGDDNGGGEGGSEEHENREINQKSQEKDSCSDNEGEFHDICDEFDEKNKNKYDGPSKDLFVELREIELLINTSTVDEVIFKKYCIQVIDKHTKSWVMEGVVVGYDLVGQSYDPDIILKFEDGRTFYNENFGYLLRFYI